MRSVNFHKTSYSLKRFIRNTSEWTQAALMLIGAFSVYVYFKQRWPELTNYTTDLASSALTICAIGFGVIYYLARPFLEGFREAGTHPKADHLRRQKSSVQQEIKEPNKSEMATPTKRSD